ncbi:MAG TPA: hemolysin family protein [Gemmatimonadaceae bacterium]|nr:hemolysin family protein [Gemmatimonadaceae bacterium]
MTAYLVLLVLTVAALSWLVAASTAVRSVSRIWLRHWAEQRLSAAGRAPSTLDRPQRLLTGASAAAGLLVILAGELLAGAHPTTGWRLGWELALLALVLLLLGQLAPRAVARRWSSRLIPVLVPPVHVLTLLFAPLLRGARRLAAAAAPPRLRQPRTGALTRDVEELLRDGELEGIGDREEIEIITGIVLFGQKVLRDVMTPRTEIFAIDITDDPRAAARAIADSGYSRVPVYRESLDEIVGMVHVFDVLAAAGERMPVLRPVAHAPATKRVSEMLFEMLRAQRHLTIVLDEFGGTAGLVTLEDLLEELVGEINDEHDEPTSPATDPATRAAVLDATTELEDVARRFGVELPAALHERAQTVGGLLVQTLGRIPAVGERFRLAGLEMAVVEAERSRVLRLLVQREEHAPATDLVLPR